MVRDFIFFGGGGPPKSLQMVTATMKLRHLLLGRKAMTNLESILKSRDITLPIKIYLVKTMVFPVVMYGCESLTIKKAERWRIDAFELWCWRRLLRLDCKQIKPVHPKGNQSWIFIGRTDAEAETLILWASDVKNLLIREDPDAEKDWGQEEKGTTEVEMVGWHHWPRTWVWASSRSWWWTGRLGVPHSTGSQKVRHDWVAELNWTAVSLLSARLWQPQQTNTKALKDDERCSLTGVFVHWQSVQEWSTNRDVAHSRPKDQHKFPMHMTLNHRLTAFSIIPVISLFLDGHFFTTKPGWEVDARLPTRKPNYRKDWFS